MANLLTSTKLQIGGRQIKVERKKMAEIGTFSKYFTVEMSKVMASAM